MLVSYDGFEFVLVYSSDTFVWNYVYVIRKENHILLKKLCMNFAEFTMQIFTCCVAIENSERIITYILCRRCMYGTYHRGRVKSQLRNENIP
jgi:hypothetical protein